MIQAQSSGLFLPDLSGDGYHIFSDLLPVESRPFFIVIAAQHAVVAHADEVVIPQLAGHGMTHLHQLVEDLFQVTALLCQETPACFCCPLTKIAVGTAHEGTELTQVAFFTFKGDACRSQYLCVFGTEFILLHKEVHDLRRKGFQRHICQTEQLRAEMRFQFLSER